MNDYGCICFSGCLYGLAFVWPPYTAFFVCIALAPLVPLFKNNAFSGWHGFVWTAITVIIVYFDLFLTIIIDGASPLKYIFFPFLVGYASMWGGLLFYSTQLLRIQIKLHNSFLISFIWCISWIWYFLGMRYGWQFISTFQQLPFHYPLVPLCATRLSSCITYFNSINILGLIIIINFLAGKRVNTQGKRYVLCLFAGFFLGSFSESIPTLETSTITPIQPPINKKENAYDNAINLMQHLQAVVKRYPKQTIFAAPESAYPFIINTQIVNMFNDYALEGRIFMFGTHEYIEKKLYNTVIMLQDGQIAFRYRKQFLLPFAEYIPWSLEKYAWFTQLFCAGGAFSKGTQEGIISIHNQPVAVRICSEFFTHGPSQKVNNTLVFANDQWFHAGMLARLMKYTVKLISLETKKNVFYVSYVQ